MNGTVEALAARKSPAIATIRWIAVLPTAFLASCAAGWAAYWFFWLTISLIPSRLELIVAFVGTAAASGWAFVAGGVVMAPRFKGFLPVALATIGACAGTLAVLGGLLASSWQHICQALIGSAAAIMTGAYVYRNKGF